MIYTYHFIANYPGFAKDPNCYAGFAKHINCFVGINREYRRKVLDDIYWSEVYV